MLRNEMLKKKSQGHLRAIRRSIVVFVATALGLVAFSGTAMATTVTFTLGNKPQPPEYNILFKQGETGNVIYGYVQGSNIQVTFSCNANLTCPTDGQLQQYAKGQADIFQDGVKTKDSKLTSLYISVAQTFTDFIMDPLYGSGSLTVDVYGVGGGQIGTFAYNLTNGSNFLTITSAVPMTAIYIQDTTVGGYFQQFKQPRISGLAVPVPVPEPNGLALFGAGLIGLGVLTGWVARRRRRSKKGTTNIG